MQKRKSSLIFSIMIMSAVIVILTALIIGGSSVVSLSTLSDSSYDTYENAMDEGYKNEIKSQVQSTISVMQAQYDMYKAGEKTEEEAKNDAKEIIRVMRYRDDQSGYFWIDDTDYIHCKGLPDAGKGRVQRILFHKGGRRHRGPEDRVFSDL